MATNVIKLRTSTTSTNSTVYTVPSLKIAKVKIVAVSNEHTTNYYGYLRVGDLESQTSAFNGLNASGSFSDNGTDHVVAPLNKDFVSISIGFHIYGSSANNSSGTNNAFPAEHILVSGDIIAIGTSNSSFPTSIYCIIIEEDI